MSGVPYFFRLWRLMRMNRLVYLFDRVFLPLVGLPHGVTGWRPPEVRPSPPPCGWSIGFIDTPRLCGFAPEPAITAGLADRDVHVVGVRHRADGAGAAAVNQTLFARIQAHDHIVLVATDHLGIGAGGARD